MPITDGTNATPNQLTYYTEASAAVWGVTRDNKPRFHGLMVSKPVVITSAAAATAVTIIPDAEVGAGRKVYVAGILVRVNGTTAWSDSTATKLTIQDSNGTPVAFFDIAKAGLTSQAVLHASTSNVTTKDAYSLMTGGTAGKGIQIVGDANFAAGSDVSVCITYFMVPT